MVYILSHLPGMLQELIALPKKHQKTIASKIDSLATNPRPQQSVLLKSKKDTVVCELVNTGSYIRSRMN